MDQIAVIYWSQTGNTEAMAQAVAAGIDGAGAKAELFEVSSITPEQAAGYDKLALGCPAMGAEVLEEDFFEPFFAELEPKLAGKKVALFGSYGWGDGEWMRDWQDRTQNDGATLCGDQGLMINEAPDDEGLQQCRQLGADLAAL